MGQVGKKDCRSVPPGVEELVTPCAEFYFPWTPRQTGSGTSRAIIPLKPKYGLTPISCHAALERSACAPFIKERRIKCINATSLHRKSGQWGTQSLCRRCNCSFKSLPNREN